MIPADRLRRGLARHRSIAIAVSGGVDSMTLAHIAHGVTAARMIHAISPAVPAIATARVRRHAAAHGWRLDIVDAGEFGDARYIANPVNRCYFCKLNLYGTIRDLAEGPVAPVGPVAAAPELEAVALFPVADWVAAVGALAGRGLGDPGGGQQPAALPHALLEVQLAEAGDPFGCDA